MEIHINRNSQQPQFLSWIPSPSGAALRLSGVAVQSAYPWEELRPRKRLTGRRMSYGRPTENCNRRMGRRSDMKGFGGGAIIYLTKIKKASIIRLYLIDINDMYRDPLLKSLFVTARKLDILAPGMISLEPARQDLLTTQWPFFWQTLWTYARVGH